MPAPSASQTICLAGNHSIAVDALNHLRAVYPQHRILCLPNRTDTGHHGWQPSLKATAQAAGIRFVSLTDLYAIPALLFLSLECDTLIKPSRFASTRLYNIHFSLLPAYRGMYPTVWPLLEARTQTGVTLHRLDAGISTGAIVAQQPFAIGPDETAHDVYLNALHHGSLLLNTHLPSLLDDTVMAYPQTEAGASCFDKYAIDFTRLTLNFNQPATAVRNQVRAYASPAHPSLMLNGWPIRHCTVLLRRSGGPPGVVIHITEAGFIITTATTDVLLHKG